MIQKIKGNIWDIDAEVFVVPVNVRKVMGKGLAQQAKERFGKDYFLAYKDWCDFAFPGACQILKNIGNYKYVINAATKDHWKDFSDYQWVEDCLVSIARFIEDAKPKSLVLCYLGCGFGGLSEKTVESITYSVMNKYDTKECIIYLVDK